MEQRNKKNKRNKKRKGRVWKTLLTLILVLGISGTGYNIWANTKGEPKSDLKFVFVHGLSGWGSYDRINSFFPYWGLSQGSIIKYLNRQGYDSYAASVAPTGSAWDRACELYAQLTGTVVDYGLEHSTRCNHERFGRDFSTEPLLENFDESTIVLLGHSFGGATIRLFSEILGNGWEAEREATDEADLSDFFKGGQKDRLFALVTLAAPSNGTTAYDMYEDPSFDVDSIEIPEKYLKSGGMVSKGTKATEDGRIKEDYAAFDMHIDNAYAMNEKITTFEDVYYFAYPCSSTEKDADGNYVPNGDITENMFMKSAILMSQYTGKTAGGIVIDESWLSNDGLVNEISAKTPSSAPGVDYTEGMEMEPGIWHVMPTVIGDHMSLQGGMTKRVNQKPFYLEMVKMIAELNR